MIRSYLFLLLILFYQQALAVDKINVYVSIPPQKFLVEAIGSEYVNVNVLLKQGQNPETFDPGPQQITQLVKSDLYFQMQLPYESQLLAGLKTGRNAVTFIAPCHCEDRIQGDPHIWLSPKYLIEIAETIASSLIKQRPDQQQYFQSNLENLRDAIATMDSDIKARLNNRRSNYFIVSHSSWAYFARHYGLVQLALEEGGKELGTKGLSTLINQAIEYNIKAVFIDAQHPAGIANILAQELDVVTIMLDPLAEDYISNMLQVSSRIAGALH
jgi:zinc transport system substrate-binding protein